MQPSIQPSTQPSRQPTTRPSTQPTSQPSRDPTQQPTAQPSRQPRSRPTNQPTRYTRIHIYPDTPPHTFIIVLTLFMYSPSLDPSATLICTHVLIFLYRPLFCNLHCMYIGNHPDNHRDSLPDNLHGNPPDNLHHSRPFNPPCILAVVLLQSRPNRPVNRPNDQRCRSVFTLLYIPPHYTALHCHTKLHCRFSKLHHTSLHYIALHHTTLHYTAPPRYATLLCTTLHFLLLSHLALYNVSMSLLPQSLIHSLTHSPTH